MGLPSFWAEPRTQVTLGKPARRAYGVRVTPRSVRSGTATRLVRLPAVVASVCALTLTGCLMPGLGINGAQPGAGPFGQYGAQPVRPPQLDIRNRSNVALVDVRLSPSGLSTWGPNLVDGLAVAVGQTLEIHGLAPGRWDIRVVDREGHVKQWRRQHFGGPGTFVVEVTSEGWAAPIEVPIQESAGSDGNEDPAPGEVPLVESAVAPPGVVVPGAAAAPQSAEAWAPPVAPPPPYARPAPELPPFE